MPFSTLYALFHIVHLFFIFLFDNFSNFNAFVLHFIHFSYEWYIFSFINDSFNFIDKFIHSKNYSFKEIWNYSFKEIIHSFEKWIIAQGYSVANYFICPGGLSSVYPRQCLEEKFEKHNIRLCCLKEECITVRNCPCSQLLTSSAQEDCLGYHC